MTVILDNRKDATKIVLNILKCNWNMQDVNPEIILAKYTPKICRRQPKIKRGMKREPVTVLFLHNIFYFTSCK